MKSITALATMMAMGYEMNIDDDDNEVWEKNEK